MSQFHKRHKELMHRHAAIVKAMGRTEDFHQFMQLNEQAKEVMDTADSCRSACRQHSEMKYSNEGYVCDSMSLPRNYKH